MALRTIDTLADIASGVRVISGSDESLDDAVAVLSGGPYATPTAVDEKLASKADRYTAWEVFDGSGAPQTGWVVLYVSGRYTLRGPDGAAHASTQSATADAVDVGSFSGLSGWRISRRRVLYAGDVDLGDLESSLARVDVRGDGADCRVAVGSFADASGDAGSGSTTRYQAVAVGRRASASGATCVSVGSTTLSGGMNKAHSVAIGYRAAAPGDCAVAIGGNTLYSSYAGHTDADVTLYPSADASDTDPHKVSTLADGESSVAIGGAMTKSPQSIVIGKNAMAGRETFTEGGTSVHRVTGKASETGGTCDSAIVIGNNAAAMKFAQYAVAIGFQAEASCKSSQTSDKSRARNVAIGINAKVSGKESVQLGRGVNDVDYTFQFRGANLFRVPPTNPGGSSASDIAPVSSASLGAGFPWQSAVMTDTTERLPSSHAVKRFVELKNYVKASEITNGTLPTYDDGSAYDSGTSKQTSIKATTSSYGVVKPGAHMTVSDGVIDVDATKLSGLGPTKVSELENDLGFAAARTHTVCTVEIIEEPEPFTCTRFSQTEWHFTYGTALHYIRYLDADGVWEFGFFGTMHGYNRLLTSAGDPDDTVISFVDQGRTDVTATISEEPDPIAYASQVPDAFVRSAVVSSDGKTLTLELSSGAPVLFNGGVQDRISGSDGRFISYDGSMRVVGTTTWLLSYTPPSRPQYIDVQSEQVGSYEWHWPPESVGMTPDERMHYVYLRYIDGKWDYGYGYYNTALSSYTHTPWNEHDLGSDKEATSLTYGMYLSFRYAQSLVDRSVATTTYVDDGIDALESRLQAYVDGKIAEAVGAVLEESF